MIQQSQEESGKDANQAQSVYVPQFKEYEFNQVKTHLGESGE